MIKPPYVYVVPILALSSLLALPLTAWPAPPDRITLPIEESSPVLLQESLSRQAAAMNLQGPVDPTTKLRGMKLMLKQTAAQSSALQQLLEDQRDPHSPTYRKWLTPEEFGERFGVNSADLGKLTAWLGSQRFTGIEIARARNWISFDGTVAAAGTAFQTAINHYREGDEIHFANSVELSIPSALAGVVGGIRGLDDFHPKPQHIKADPKYTLNGYHYLAPDDIAAIYDLARLYAAGIDGTGQKLAIVGQTDLDVTQIAAFRSYFGLSVNNPQFILTGPDPGYSPGDASESYLDLEWSGAVARNATILFVYSNDVFTSALYEIDQNLAPVMSMSYGFCELWTGTGIQVWAQQANAEGITWMVSSGDSGAACDPNGSSIAVDGLGVSSPADVPEITAVGGTEFNEGSTGWSAQNGPTQASVSGYLPEMAWNDAVAFGQGIVGGGGGISVKFPKPWWQTGPGVPNDGARDVPDVSLTASADHDGYLVWAGGLQAWGGTSASSPAFAGIVTLINHYLATQNPQFVPGLGNINPNLYSLAQSTGSAFHDVTVGSNIVPCQIGTTDCTTGTFGYKAGPGYDLATGLGSVDAYNLVTNWSSGTGLVATTATLASGAATISQNGSTQLTATVTPASGTTVPSGTFTFTVGGNPIGTATAAASAGTSAAATFSLSGAGLSVGSNAITAVFVSTGGFSGSVATVNVTVTVISTTTTFSASPTSILANQSSQFLVTVTPSSGSTAPLGALQIFKGSTSMGAVALSASGSNGVTTITMGGQYLALGSNSLTMEYMGATGFSSSVSSPVVIKVSPVVVASTTTVSASPISIAPNGTTQLSVTVTLASGSTAPTGSLAFVVGQTSLGTASLTASGSTGKAVLTISASSLTTGSNNISVAYAGNSGFSGSTGSAVVTVAPPIQTSVVATASPSTIAIAAYTTVTALVKPSSGSIAPAGSVTFTTAGVTLGTATLVTSGSSASATFTVRGANLATGANAIAAAYSGSTAFSSSVGSVSVSLPATGVATTTAVTASPAIILTNAATQLTVSVKAAKGTVIPTGLVTFVSGGVSLGSANLATVAGVATANLSLNATSLTTGANSITATYFGNSTFNSSTALATVTVTAPTLPTSLSATASPASIAANATAQISVTVTPSSGSASPTGTVKFTVGQTTLGTATLNAATAVLTVSAASLATGANTITTTYAGSGAFAASTGSIAVTVAPPIQTSLAATASPASIPATGTTQISITATPASGSAAPTGTIKFTVGQTTLGTATLNGATAVLTVSVASLATGVNTITATYAGNSAFAASTGSTTVTVAPPIQTSLAATASPASIAPSGTTQISITVTPASGSTAPTGTIALSLGQTKLGTATLNAATPVLTINGSALATGANTITATYQGNGGFASSAGAVTVTVTTVKTAVTLTAAANPATIASSGSTQLSITVTAASGSTAPTGTITISLGQTSLGTASLVASGLNATAVLAVKGSSLASGLNTITATYAGTSLLSGSTGTTTVTVPPSASKVVVSAAKGSSVQAGFTFNLTLHETAGLATTVTGYTICGTNFSSVIANSFGSANLPANGTVSATASLQWSPLPNPLVFVLSGADASGTKWTQTVSLATK